MASAPRGWVYVDDKRTHEVRAAVTRASPPAFVIQERALGSRDARETFEESHPLAEPWEWRALQMALEMRLSLLGRYHRMTIDQPGWSPIAAPPPGRRLELAPLDVGADVRPEFHHYERQGATHAVTLAGIPDAEGRFALTRLDYRFPDVDGGNLRIVHERLPLVVYRSVLASIHLELADRGYRKVERGDSTLAGDARWWAAMQACLDALLGRLSEGRVGSPGDPPRAAGAFQSTVTRIEAQKLKKRIADASARATRVFDTEDEIGLASATPVEGKRPEVLLDSISPDVVSALHDPKLAALVARYLPEGEDARLIDLGERAVRDAMKRRRAGARPDEQHLLSIVEAALLVRRALGKRGAKLELDTINTLRHAPAYL